MDAVCIFIILCGLLVVGKIIRYNLPFLQRLYLPSAVVGGVVGLGILTVFGDRLDPAWTSAIRAAPGFLINVVFATLFLGTALPRIGKIFGVAFPQLVLGQTMAWGQYVIGLGLAGFFLSPVFGVPPAFGNLLEIGFEGGHGTVGGMEESFLHFGWEDGIALGFTIATVGMIFGVVAGMAMINWAYRHGHVTTVVPFESRNAAERRGIHPADARPAAGFQTMICDSIDSLAWHLAIVGVAIAIGAGLHALIPMKGFPLFPLCMIGGILLQATARKAGLNLFIDRGQVERISGAALDFLVVSAVATIRLDVVAAHWQPLLILIASGAVWSVFVVFFFGPRLFREAWFERSIADFGQATGVTATGLMLLRTVDPENRTCAAASFGYKQLLHEPIMGGGIWTALALALVYQWGWRPVFAISLGMLLLWIGAAFLLARRNRCAA